METVNTRYMYKTHVIEGALFIKTDRIHTLNWNWRNHQIKNKTRCWKICRHTDWLFALWQTLLKQTLCKQNLSKEDLTNKQTNKQTKHQANNPKWDFLKHLFNCCICIIYKICLADRFIQMDKSANWLKWSF